MSKEYPIAFQRSDDYNAILIYRLWRKAFPKVRAPKVDSRLRRIGTGFLSLMARGIAEAPRTTEASRLNSTP